MKECRASVGRSSHSVEQRPLEKWPEYSMKLIVAAFPLRNQVHLFDHDIMSKMSVLVHALDIKTVHEGRGAKWQNYVHVVVECPLS